MKKITDFIIDKRYLILILFIILTVISAFLSKDVKINYDIAKYLPNNSDTRIGMDIMEKEFSDVETSTLNVMFESLAENEKMSIREELSSIRGVKEVDYDATENYNRGKYTLYAITVDDKADSQLAADVYDAVQEKYGDYSIFTSGDVTDTNESVLPFWIIALAVFCALIILLIMCESFVEPFLFLFTILMAVVLNKGTNIIFPSVSHITDSIAAILQMALSMDYSIMLMNRYDQEKKIEKDKVKAMKEALHKAFQSISSSSVTTIVGLLALVFMSFKIGKDLGFILAKGVLFSLICIFFVLPSLILLFDKWILKTKKRAPHISLNKLGKFSHKFRFVSLPLFIIVLGSSFMLKGNLGIDYTDEQSDEISKIFKENNQIAIIYKNSDEKKIDKHLKKLEEAEKVDEVLGYGNTINEKLPHDKLKTKLNDLGSDVSVEDYLLRIVYYNYYNNDRDNSITLADFLNFIEEEAYNNVNINKKIDENTKKDVTRLKKFVIESEINKKRTASDIADILEIDKSDIKDLYIYYLSENDDLKMSLKEFVNFMNGEVLNDKKYAKRIDAKNREKLKILSKFVNSQNITKKMTYKEISELFGIDINKVDELFQYYILKNDIDVQMTIAEFSNFVLKDVLTNNKYSDNFDEKTIQNIELLATFSDQNTIKSQMNSEELSHLFGLSSSDVNDILLLKYMNEKNDSKYTIAEFIEYVTAIKENTDYLNDVDVSAIELLRNSPLFSDPNEYSSEALAKKLSIFSNIDEEQINLLYNLIDWWNKNTSDWKVNPQEFVQLILDHIDDEKIKGSIDGDTLEKLKRLDVIMDRSVDNTKFDHRDMSKIIDQDGSIVKNIYALYVISKNNTTMTPQEFVSFILENKNDSVMASSISKDDIEELSLIQTIMNSVLNDVNYSNRELSSLLSIDGDDTQLLYGLYNSFHVNRNYEISLKNFIEFVLNKVITNEEYADNFDEEKIIKLNTVDTIMNNSLKNKKYTRDEIFDIIKKLSDAVDKNTIEILYIYYGSINEYDEKWQMTVEEFVNYLNDDILLDERFMDFIEEDMKNDIIDAKTTIKDAKDLLIGDEYSRVVLNTKLDLEGSETFKFVKKVKNMLERDIDEFYVIGDSPMANEMSMTFNDELNTITVITMFAIFIVVMITFKSVIIPIILVLIIQCAVYTTMGILSFTGENVYFISILIVQSILMGATIDYAILYTSYYLEHRRTLGIKESVVKAYNSSINTILTSSSILIIVTLIIASFTSAIAAKICKTISEGTLCSTILILFLLPAILSSCDKLIIKNKKSK